MSKLLAKLTIFVAQNIFIHSLSMLSLSQGTYEINKLNRRRTKQLQIKSLRNETKRKPTTQRRMKLNKYFICTENFLDVIKFNAFYVYFNYFKSKNLKSLLPLY